MWGRCPTLGTAGDGDRNGVKPSQTTKCLRDALLTHASPGNEPQAAASWGREREPGSRLVSRGRGASRPPCATQPQPRVMPSSDRSSSTQGQEPCSSPRSLSPGPGWAVHSWTMPHALAPAQLSQRPALGPRRAWAHGSLLCLLPGAHCIAFRSVSTASTVGPEYPALGTAARKQGSKQSHGVWGACSPQGPAYTAPL